jgi:hypothetical protein
MLETDLRAIEGAAKDPSMTGTNEFSGKFSSLTPAFIERVNCRPMGWPKRDQFIGYCRKTLNITGSHERNYPNLARGKPVPSAFANAFVEYARRVWRWEDVSYETCCTSAPFVLPADPEGAWRDPRTMVSESTTSFKDDESMYFHSLHKDAVDAANMIFRSFGLKVAAPGEPLDEQACFLRAEKHMKRTPNEYSRWLLSMWKVHFRTVMFASAHDDRKIRHRVGVSVVLPLKEAAYSRIAAGNLRDMNITPDDLEFGSRFIFFGALADAVYVPNVDSMERTRAQIRTVMYQLAYFMRHNKNKEINVLALVSNLQYAQRFHRIGFRNIGVSMHNSDKPLIVFRNPKLDGRKDIRRHLSFRLIILILDMYRLANRRGWNAEDALDG